MSGKPSDAELKEKIKDILEKNEGGMVTLKGVRKQLEKHFEIDFKDRKEDIKNLVIEVNSEQDDEEEESEEEEIEIKKKKSKKKKKKRKRRGSDGDDEESDEEPAKKKRKLDHVELSDNGYKRCVVQRYQGKLQVHIRTYYRKGDDWLPTKKGIALNVDEWEVLKESVGDIDKMIDEKN